MQAGFTGRILRWAVIYDKLTSHCSEFERVLPLPSDAWQEFYADIFCHMDHSHGSPSSQPPSTIQPREGDCLVADDKLLVTISSLRQESIAIDSSKVAC